jgi:hypothetical protein
VRTFIHNPQSGLLSGRTHILYHEFESSLSEKYLHGMKLPFWNLILLYLITLVKFWEEYKLWRSSLWIFPPFGYLFFKYCPQTSVYTYFITYYHTHIKSQVKIIVLGTLIFRLLICYFGPKIYELCQMWKASLAIFILWYCHALRC